jgi:acetyltransferase
MDKQPLAPLFDPERISVWLDDSTPQAIRHALTERLSGAQTQLSYWPASPEDRIDLALIASAPESLMQSLRQAAGLRAKAAIILTTDVDQSLQAALREEALAQRIALVGPASFGLQRPSRSLNASICSTTAAKGRVALVSQSGALASSILDWAAEYKLGFSAVVTLGNEIDVDIARTLDFLASDHETHAIVIYLECVANPRAFLSALRAAASIKPVVLLKAGATTHDPTDPLTHTTALVGADDVFDAAIRRSGAVRVQYFIQLFAAVRMLTSNRPTHGRQLAVISNGRGPALLVQDLARVSGIGLAPLSEHNPVIIRLDADGEQYKEKILALSKAKEVDAILVIHSPHIGVDTAKITEAVAQAAAGINTLVFGCWLGDHSTREMRNWLSSQGVPSFRTPEAAVDAFHSLAAFRANQELLQQVPPALSSDIEPDLEGARMIIETAIADRRNALTEIESKSLLSAFGVPVSATTFARNANEAALVAHQVGFPVVIKINSPDIAHKSEVGGVRLNLKNAHEVRDAYTEMIERVESLAPKARLEGVVVQRYVEHFGKTEVYIGMATDPLFGPIISFGAGGEKVRWANDRALELPPLNALLARRLIERTRLGQQLAQDMPQGLESAAVQKLEKILLQVSDMICEMPAIKEIDINPVIMADEGPVVVDARMVIEKNKGPGRSRYGHLAIMPYPGYLTREYPLKSGSTYMIRPLRWSDGENLKRLLLSLSEESRFMRFLSNIKEFTPKQLARLTQIDYHRDIALAAVVDHCDREDLIGVARYMLLPNSSSAEFALVVQDAYQGQGIGSTLMTSLFEVARNQQLKEIEGMVLAKNTGMLGLMTHLGFRIEVDPEDHSLRRVVKTLDA